MREDHFYIGGVFGQTVDERLPEAVVELEVGCRVAMGYSHVLLSDHQGALLVSVKVTQVHRKLGLARRESSLDGLPQEHIDLHGSVSHDGGAWVLLVDALHVKNVTVTSA